jgi:malonate transporter and related proteins
MAKVLADALVPIFTGVLLGYWAGRRGLMDSINIRNLIIFVMTFYAPCALFSIIIGTSREVLQQQVMTAFAIALVFIGIYLGCFFGARYRVGMSIPDGAVLALTVGFPNSAAMAVSLLSSTFGPEASVPAALSIVVGSMTIVPITLDLLELGSKTVEPKITAGALFRGILRSFARPVVWAPIIALLFVCLHVHFPTYAMRAFNTLGSAISGSALVLTGLVISAQPFRMSPAVLSTTAAKLIAQPPLALCITLLLHMSHDQIRSITLISAIPGGFFGVAFGKSLNATPEIASSGLVATYGFAVVTLPLWILILSQFVRA